MKTRILSLSAAVGLSFTHFLLELWRGFLDFSYVLPDYSGGSTGSMSLIAAVYVLVFAGWLMGLQSAQQGRRGGIVTALIVGALFWVGMDLGTIFFYCPGGCEALVFDIATYVSLVVGALALFGLATNLRSYSRVSNP